MRPPLGLALIRPSTTAHWVDRGFSFLSLACCNIGQCQRARCVKQKGVRTTIRPWLVTVPQSARAFGRPRHGVIPRPIVGRLANASRWATTPNWQGSGFEPDQQGVRHRWLRGLATILICSSTICCTPRAEQGLCKIAPHDLGVRAEDARSAGWFLSER